MDITSERNVQGTDNYGDWLTAIFNTKISEII